MRVKTVPRHLPRRLAAAARGRAAPGERPAGPSPPVRTVNFSTVGDVVEQLDREAGGQERRSDDAAAEAALDLSTRPRRGCGSGDAFKDTYLYQLMTDPQFLQRASRESRVQLAGAARAVGEGRATRCPYCKREFGSEAELRAHSSPAGDGAKEQLSCCACGKSFAQKRYLRYHQRSHSERSKYACDICTRKYSRLDNLTRHNIFHTNPDKFPCGSCERTFARKDLLNKHLKCHENKYKYHCDICQKYFKGPVSLDNHTKLFHAPTQHQRQRSFQLSSSASSGASSFTSQSC